MDCLKGLEVDTKDLAVSFNVAGELNNTVITVFFVFLFVVGCPILPCYVYIYISDYQLV